MKSENCLDQYFEEEEKNNKSKCFGQRYTLSNTIILMGYIIEKFKCYLFPSLKYLL